MSQPTDEGVGEPLDPLTSATSGAVDAAVEDGAPTAGAPLDGASDTPEAASPMTVEEIISLLEQVTAERDEYLATAQRLQAEFDNFRKRSAADAAERAKAGAARLAEALLPVLDACQAAAVQGDESATAIHNQLLAVMEREGLERIPATDELFDPNLHEAVMHEPGDGEPTVSEELRTGYRIHGRVIRASMVKVRG